MANSTQKNLTPAARARISWRQIRRRAVDPRLDSRGSHSVCAAEWLDELTGFSAFLCDVGLPAHAGQILRRRDPSRPWAAANAFWSDEHPPRRRPPPQDESLEAFGYRLSVPAWAKVAGVTAAALRKRLLRMPLAQAVAMPAARNRRQGTRRQCADALVAQVMEALSRE